MEVDPNKKMGGNLPPAQPPAAPPSPGTPGREGGGLLGKLASGAKAGRVLKYGSMALGGLGALSLAWDLKDLVGMAADRDRKMHEDRLMDHERALAAIDGARLGLEEDRFADLTDRLANAGGTGSGELVRGSGGLQLGMSDDLRMLIAGEVDALNRIRMPDTPSLSQIYAQEGLL